jgi:hypothetical protein
MRPMADVGGSGETVVVDIPGVQRVSGLMADGSHAYAELATRIRGLPMPDMPPDVAAQVQYSVGDVAGQLGTMPQPLFAIAQELRVRALWAEIADQLMAGTDLSGTELNEFKAAYASGLLTRYAEPWQQDLAKAYADKLHHEEHPGGFSGFMHSVGSFFSGAWDAIKDPAVALYHLTPFSSGWTQHWEDLGKGLAYGVTHPVQFGEEMINLQALHQRGFAYWLGNLAPAAAATVFSGGAAAGLRGAEAADRITAGAAGIERLADGEDALAASARLAKTFEGDHQWTFDVMHPGPLTPDDASLAALRRSAAQTFASGKYDLASSDKPYVLFKAGDSPGGRFFTFDPPASEAQVRIDSAVKPHWTTPEGTYTGSSSLDKGYAFVVEHPEHPVAVGPVGTQGGVYLGGPDKLQVFVDDRSALGLRQVGEWSLHDPPDWVKQMTESGR